MEWLRRRREELRSEQSPHRLVAICSGTLLAARAGLLGHRSCTTHHELLDVLRTAAPSARVIDNRVFVVDGPIASSAGITAGIDLALHLIAEECGEALAATVAEDMVVYLRRSPSDPELSPFLMHRRPSTPRGAPGAGCHPQPAFGGLGHGGLARWATPPSGTSCGSSASTSGFRRFIISAPSGWSGPGRRWNAGRASPGRRSRRGSLRPAAAPGVEPSVGWVAAGSDG